MLNRGIDRLRRHALNVANLHVQTSPPSILRCQPHVRQTEHIKCVSTRSDVADANRWSSAGHQHLDVRVAKARTAYTFS